MLRPSIGKALVLLYRAMTVIFSPTCRSDWGLDVGALMILVGEDCELRYRRARRSFVEAIVACPVAGIQSYLKDYDEILSVTSSMTYFSPYGCKSAPLRNMKLENAIRQMGLMADGNYNVFHITSEDRRRRKGKTRPELCLRAWCVVSWVIFIGVIAFCILSPWTTWISTTNCVVLTIWSVGVRVFEHLAVIPTALNVDAISYPDDPDAIFILGRCSSAFILEGSRKDIKRWTSPGLELNPRVKLAQRKIKLKVIIRASTIVVLLLIFSTVPNGSTIDQAMFVALNVLGQANTMLGSWLNAQCCLDTLERRIGIDGGVAMRTQLSARLIRDFHGRGEKNWIEKAQLLPQTHVWMQWSKDLVDNKLADPKRLYNQIHARELRNT